MTFKYVTGNPNKENEDFSKEIDKVAESKLLDKNGRLEI